MAGSFKKTKVELGRLTEIDRLLTVEKSTRLEVPLAVHQYIEANNNYIKDYNKIKNHCIFSIWM